jgi:hypothetical protein
MPFGLVVLYLAAYDTINDFSSMIATTIAKTVAKYHTGRLCIVKTGRQMGPLHAPPCPTPSLLCLLCPAEPAVPALPRWACCACSALPSQLCLKPPPSNTGKTDLNQNRKIYPTARRIDLFWVN